jgi:deoxyribonuclease-4
MLFGANVSTAGGFLLAIDRAADMGAEVMQFHAQNPRMWKPYPYGDDVMAEFAARLAAHRGLAGLVCHGSYLINLATADPELRSKSRATLVHNLEVASRLGASGLVLHPGSHLGSGLDQVAAALASDALAALEAAGDRLGREPCMLLFENTAGAGGTIGRTFDELALLLDLASCDRRLGVCLDTQHLFASGVTYATLDQADAVVASIDRAVGLDRLRCLHVNDSKVPLGANRDRHENLGEGHIGRLALGALLGHPALQGLPAILEVPGVNRQGPAAADLAAARAIHAAGQRRWRARLARGGAATQPPLPGPRRAPDARTGSRRGPRPAGSPSLPARRR